MVSVLRFTVNYFTAIFLRGFILRACSPGSAGGGGGGGEFFRKKKRGPKVK